MALFCFCFALTVRPVFAGFDEAAAAFAVGDYVQALKEIRPLAEQGDPRSHAIIAAALSGVLLLFLTRRWSVEWGGDEDLSPQPVRPLAGVAIDIQPDQGPVMVVVEYLIDPARAADFAQVMQATRRARLRQGALSWGLFRDTAVPGRYVEYFVDESWVEHQRRMERFTVADSELRAQRLAFHLLPGPPVVKRYVAETMTAGPTMPL